MNAPDGSIRGAYANFASLLDGLSLESLATKQQAAEEIFRRLGITFAVYGEAGSTERLLPPSLALPRRAPPPLGYFAETSRAATRYPRPRGLRAPV